MIRKYKAGFSLAEALITLVIISLVMAATMPIVIKSQNSPSEAPWKYITQGDLSQNAAVFTVLGETSSAVFGDKRIPIDSNISSNKDTIYATKLNPRLSIITRNRISGPVVARHLLDFYEKETNGNYTAIGKISFDQFYNLALGQNALDAIKSDTASAQKVKFDAGTEIKWNEISRLDTGAVDTTNTLGAANTAVGQYSMAGNLRYTKLDSETNAAPNITGVGNTALGAFSMRRLSQGNLNTGLGLYALQEAQSSSYNTAVGAYALKANTTGHQNNAVGTFALESNTSGKDNTAFGTMTAQKNTTGDYNVAIGNAALRENTTGANNVSVGYNAQGLNTTGANNVSLGSNAMSINTTGSDNIAIGYNALKSNTSGNYNIAIGNYSYQGNTTGNGNITIGYNVGVANSNNKLYIGGYVNGGTTTLNGTDSLIYGDMANKELVFNTKSLKLGDENETSGVMYLRSNTTEIGLSDSSTTILKGNAYINKNGNNYLLATVQDVYNFMETMTVNAVKVNWNTTLINTAISDARLKNILGDNNAGLKEIMQIQVKNYTMKRDKKKEVLVGVIAQELQKVFPNSVVEGRDGYLRIKRDEIFYACINAIKELNNMFQDIAAKITGLEEKIRILEDQNKINEDKIAALERQNKLFEERLAALENNSKKAAVKKVKETEKTVKQKVNADIVNSQAAENIQEEEKK